MVQTLSRYTSKSNLAELKDRLARYRQIRLGVAGRKSGQIISRPVWFVFEGDTLYLLPVQGSDMQWYKNILQNPSIRISARGVEGEFPATPVTDPKEVSSIAEKFREKYGGSDVKKYYSKFDVAVIVDLSEKTLRKKQRKNSSVSRN
jgi:deazaflavin-dependent oxidoreductase (nitroreductase family)